MLDTLLNNLTFILYGVGIYILTLITNIITSIAVNTTINDIKFDINILKQGLFKYGLTLLGTTLLTIIITLLIQYTTYYEIIGDYFNEVNIVIIATTYTLTTINYMKKIYEDIKTLIK